MTELPKTTDAQAEAEIEWWQGAHDLAETKRLQLVKTCERALTHIEKSLEEEDFGEVWAHWQKARRLLKRELEKGQKK